jgi:hypothetical protein
MIGSITFAAEQWDHLHDQPHRSVFATVRCEHRTRGSLSPATAMLVMFKQAIAASKITSDVLPSRLREFPPACDRLCVTAPRSVLAAMTVLA